MPSKRSKSQERERKRKQRLQRTAEKTEIDLGKAMLGMRKLRGEKTEEEKEWAKISKKHSMRKLRMSLSSEKYLEQNQKAKDGMRINRNEGFVRPYAERGDQNSDEIDDWKKFMNENKKQALILEDKNPDIVERINEKNRARKKVLEENSRVWKQNTDYEKLWKKHNQLGNKERFNTLTDEEKFELTDSWAKIEQIKERREMDREEKKKKEREIIEEEENSLEKFYTRESNLSHKEKTIFEKLIANREQRKRHKQFEIGRKEREEWYRQKRKKVEEADKECAKKRKELDLEQEQLDKMSKQIEQEKIKRKEQENEEKDDSCELLDRRQLMKKALENRHKKSKDI